MLCRIIGVEWCTTLSSLSVRVPYSIVWVECGQIQNDDRCEMGHKVCAADPVRSPEQACKAAAHGLHSLAC